MMEVSSQKILARCRAESGPSAFGQLTSKATARLVTNFSERDIFAFAACIRRHHREGHEYDFAAE